MREERGGAQALLLCDGRVAVIGGSGNGGRRVHDSVEAYGAQPRAQWRNRVQHTARRL